MKNTNIEFLTVAEVSNSLKIHWQTTLRYIKSKRLKAIRIGKGYRVEKSDFKNFIKNNQLGG